MADHILILEPDKAFVARLVRALKKLDSFAISVVPTVREALEHLAQQRQDVAFIPVTEDDQLVRSLRDVQPDLRLVLMTPKADFDVPQSYLGKVQGVLIKLFVDIDLPTVIQEALEQPVPLAKESENEHEAEVLPAESAFLLAALERVKPERFVQTAVLAHGTRLLAYWGELNERQAATVALHVGKGWGDAPHTAQVQFMRLPAHAGDMLLYTRSVANGHLLTLVVSPDTTLSKLRAQADTLATSLKETEGSQNASHTVSTAETDEERGERKSYALVWRPVKSLPPGLHTPLRLTLKRLAVENACVLKYVTVQPELVHIVVSCPPGRDSAWAAYLFKNGSEEAIQEEYGVTATIWEPGFYAVDSSEPLFDAELNIFM
jgi:hypothetical protein